MDLVGEKCKINLDESSDNTWVERGANLNILWELINLS